MRSVGDMIIGACYEDGHWSFRTDVVIFKVITITRLDGRIRPFYIIDVKS